MAYEGPHPFPLTSGGTAVTSSTPVIQIQSTLSTSSASTTNAMDRNTLPTTSDGAAYSFLDTSITPKNSNNILYVYFLLGNTSSSAAGDFIITALFQSGSSNALATFISRNSGGTANSVQIVSGTYKMTAGVADEVITFSIRYGIDGSGTAFIGNSYAGFISMMQVTEVAP